MTKYYYKPQRILLFTFLLFFIQFSFAQGLLEQKISVDFDHTSLADVLKEIGTKSNFYFSYNGNLLAKDSLVSLTVKQQPVYSVMEQLFHGKYEFEEQNKYVIISEGLPHLSLINTDVTSENHVYSISGIVVDERSGERLMNVSVYEKEHLAATLTDEHGYFKLKFRAGNSGTLSITASKIQYKDVSLNFLQTVAVNNRTKVYDYKKNGKGVERDIFGRFFISAREQIQSLNIPDFFAKRPFQLSLTPGLSTHGLFSSQVVNKFSLNLAGGYTADTSKGVSIGLINIIRNGFYRVSLSANSRLNTNIAFTSGTHSIYTIIHAGINAGGEKKAAFGLGIGHDFMFSDRLFLSATVDYQIATQGDYSFNDNWKQGKLLLNAQLTKHLSVFAGPVYNIYTTSVVNPYVYPNYYNYILMRVHQKSLGWEAGISFNSVFKPAPKIRYDSENWYLGMAALGGLNINSSRNFVGGELFTQRDLSGNVAATLSAGYLQRMGDYKPFPTGFQIDGVTNYESYGIKALRLLPIKAGIRTYTGRRLFFSGELGAMIALNNSDYVIRKKGFGPEIESPLGNKMSTGFIVGASGGYTLGNGLEAGAGYSNAFGQEMQMINIRLGYRIKLSK